MALIVRGTRRAVSSIRQMFSEIMPNTDEYVQKHNKEILDRVSNMKHFHPIHDMHPTMAPDFVDKINLCWYSKFPSMKAIPERVSCSQVADIRTKTRVAFNLWATCGTLVLMFSVAMIGRRDHAQGMSAHKMALQKRFEYKNGAYVRMEKVRRRVRRKTPEEMAAMAEAEEAA